MESENNLSIVKFVSPQGVELLWAVDDEGIRVLSAIGLFALQELANAQGYTLVSNTQWDKKEILRLNSNGVTKK